MQYIDEKFKERSPLDTVCLIRNILSKNGILIQEKWLDSGIDNCWSLQVSTEGGVPFANGKGVTKELAMASAYGEFIERLQGGLFFYKHQSIIRQKDLNIHSFAPDAKYMTVDELIANGEWMDYIIQTYKGSITRQSIARLCKIYACVNDGRILTLPFYSLFEDKYVYLPIDFIDQVFATNGCCVGNSREEAWVHALSEIMERHATLSILTSGKSAPRISSKVLSQFKVVSRIINEIRQDGNYDIEMFDFSVNNGFPVISTRIINKETHSYIVNVAADPVLEIAIQRTLTEIFQGRTIKNFTSNHNGEILGKVSDYPIQSNTINQLETGNGLFTADFFAEEVTCEREMTDFADNSHMTNKELLAYMLDLYRNLNKPVYVRNFSFLGFPCYRFVVPGFSEAFAAKMSNPIMEFALADQVSQILKNIGKATNDDLNCLLVYNKMISSVFSRYNNFGRLAGVPITGKNRLLLICVSRAYAAYRLGKYSDAIKFMEPVIKSKLQDKDVKEYFGCVNFYLKLQLKKVEEEKIRVILPKFYSSMHSAMLYQNIDRGGTPYDDFLLVCDTQSCDLCKHRNDCYYENCKRITTTIGKCYVNFVHGQDRQEFL